MYIVTQNEKVAPNLVQLGTGWVGRREGSSDRKRERKRGEVKTSSLGFVTGLYF